MQGCRDLCRLVCGALSRFRRSDDPGSEVASGWGVVTVDLCEKDDRVIVSMKLPGMNQENLQIGIVSDQLTVSGERCIEQESGDGSYRIVRCAYRSFRRDLTLPHRIDAQRVQARYRDGVLHIEMPRLPEQLR
jgi:HSP20 family protein